MEQLKIEPYKPERDEASIIAMLCENEQFNMFQQSNKMLSDGIFVVRYNDLTVGFLSFDGFKRRALTTIFVNEEYRRMGIGATLMEKTDKMLSQNGADEIRRR
ncbi:GNAT family N-acetyltransferase [Paenibacillus sp. FSL R5-0470]|uniref:GNAT family N-acetyltransferase n=1 Tax=Paenibacillus sp. FSL R5-0470 TaxID=2921641 RepID=UPI0030DDD95B